MPPFRTETAMTYSIREGSASTPRQVRARRRAALLLVTAALSAATPPRTLALDFRWGNSFGGTFSTGLNWLNGTVPGTNDTADFGVVLSGTGPSYNVNFTTSP